MNKQLRLILIPIITLGSLTGCVMEWTSQVLFYQYCNEEGRIGQFIYERVGLGPEFFREIPTDPRELSRLDKRFYIEGKTLLIDKVYLKQFYTFNYYDTTELSSIGPIKSVKSTITRKLDGKLLSKTMHLSNMRARTGGGLYEPNAVKCPSGKDENGMSRVAMNHATLIEKTFYFKKQLKD